ncbi:thiamine-phosphate kinase [Cellulomonas fengjieae]|uniref:thiamine-phosphate kinase n=1 Tax=Cellulomonas fengjieae TaxID=2819978 RepID=UPI001AAFBBC0|nr:thiamine-phosphate kinase [Cellulomonas fengjieae]MBO3101337.1 thiamine-phosphate kinase [Cellulomonas fengjieae]
MTADTPPASDGPLVRELSEDDLLARILPLLPRGEQTLVPSGDDAAVVAAPDGRFVVTTDVLVEDRHFRRAWSSGQDVGRRAAVQNLADVAAMGASPTSLVVALVIPGDLPVSWVEGLARGLAAECLPLGVGVVGGDLSGGPAVVVAVTAHGDLGGRAPVLRSGARAGDLLAHAGVAGRSAAGLALLEAGRADVDPELVAAHLRPVAPVAAGPEAASAGASAMLDVSDGLLRDAGRMARASGVRIELDSAAFRQDQERLRAAADTLGAVAQRWVLDGGEDHGLLAAFPPGCALPDAFRPVGRVRAGAGVHVDGEPAPAASGWDHFAG